MKLFITGATGSVGRHLVPQALERGHHVTAFVRSPRKIESNQPRLTVLEGDPLDAGALQKALPGHDVVISSLGAVGRGPTTVVQDGVRALVPAMKGAGVDGLILVSAALMFPPKGLLAPLFMIERLVLKNVMQDLSEAEDSVFCSGLRYMIARPPRFTDEPSTGTYRTREGGNPPGVWSIGRADLAQFLLDEVEKGSLSKNIIGVCR